MMPQRLLGSTLKGLQFSLSVTNAFTIASRDLQGQDPETDGVGSTALPIPGDTRGLFRPISNPQNTLT